MSRLGIVRTWNDEVMLRGERHVPSDLMRAAILNEDEIIWIDKPNA